MLATVTRLTEHVTQDSTSRVDRQHGVLRGVKIIGKVSRNGRTYSDRALEQAAAMYQGIAVNINHPETHSPTRDRKIHERFGELRNVTRRASGVYGDLYFSKSHSQANHICDLAENMPSQLGLSHNAEGNVVHHNGNDVVESVERVISVDLVTNPATNRGLFESEHGENMLAHEIKQTFRAMVEAAFDDESLDTKATLAKIKEILKQQKKLLVSMKTEQPESDDEPGIFAGDDDLLPSHLLPDDVGESYVPSRNAEEFIQRCKGTSSPSPESEAFVRRMRGQTTLTESEAFVRRLKKSV